jgi:excinuclease ABC subunit A
VLDEPSVGLHPRDIERLLGIIRGLTDAGNTVVVVEHDEAMIRAADHVIEVGPEPGARGGHVVFSGGLAGLLRCRDSITGAYLSGRETIPNPTRTRPAPTAWLTVEGATKHNLRELSFRLPLQRLVCLSGVSGSGKSTLLDNVIHQGLLAQRLQLTEDPAAIVRLACDQEFSDIVLVDQSPLSRTPRSNPALYTEASGAHPRAVRRHPRRRRRVSAPPRFPSTAVRDAATTVRSRGRASRNAVSRTRLCLVPVCEGRRFKPEVLSISWSGRSVSDVLATSVDDALTLFASEPEIRRRLSALADVGLG